MKMEKKCSSHVDKRHTQKKNPIHSTYATLENIEKSTPEVMTTEINPKDINNFHYSKVTMLISYED